MKEKALIKAVLDKNMPDFDEVRRRCLQSAPEAGKMPLRRVAFAGALGCVAVGIGLYMYSVEANKKAANLSEGMSGITADSMAVPESASIAGEEEVSEKYNAVPEAEDKAVLEKTDDSERIVINEAQDAAPAKIAAEGRRVSPEQAEAWGFDFIKRLRLPAVMDRRYEEIYTAAGDGSYTVLHDYGISCWEAAEKDNNKFLKFHFSKDFMPLRDCFYLTDEAQVSQIGDTPVIIYQWQDSYIAWFTCRGINFDIEAHHWSGPEFLSLLRSIIAEPEN